MASISIECCLDNGGRLYRNNPVYFKFPPMRFSLRALAFTIAFASLIIAIVVANQRAYEAESEFGDGDSWVFSIGTTVTLDPSAKSEQAAMDEIQGAAFRILCKPKYDPIFNAIAPQIRLEFHPLGEARYDLDCRPIGRVKKSNESLVNDYRDEFYQYIRQYSAKAAAKNGR